MPENDAAPPPAALMLFRLAALFSLLAVAMGSVVCATDSGTACLTWPGCQPDRFTPRWEIGPAVEFVHRVIAMTGGALILASAVWSLLRPRADRVARILTWVASAGALAAGVFGRQVVLGGLPVWLGAVDLFAALTAMTAMTAAAVRLDRRGEGSGTAFPLPAVTVVAVVALHVSGVLVAGKGSYTRCLGWPWWETAPGDVPGWRSVRLGLAAVTAVLVVVTAVRAVLDARTRRWGVAVAVLFVTEMALGLVIRSQDLTYGLAAGYSVVAVAVLWSLVLLASVSLGSVTSADRRPVRFLEQPPDGTGQRG